MDNPRSGAANGEDHVGIPDDLRCKRSDGKQWRCTAMSMPDKTVCEKHYIQAKKRAANSALRASLKKAKRKSLGESAVCLESKSDDMDMPLVNTDDCDYPVSVSGKKYKERIFKNQIQNSPESPPLRSISVRKTSDDVQADVALSEENWRSYRTPPPLGMESSRNISQKSYGTSAMDTSEEQSDDSTDSSDDMGSLTCHQCRRTDKNSVVWCRKCDRRGYCGICISTWYSDIPLAEIQRVCPACRGICNCKVCSRGDNLIKARIREIPVLDKLQYLYCLLSSVLPVVKQINQEQCAEVELEKKLHGAEVDLERTKLNADEQMCCDCCRVPIVDYHRHCANCLYDLCLSCCQDLRETSLPDVKEDLVENSSSGTGQGREVQSEQLRSSSRVHLEMKFPGWRANRDGSIPCLPRSHGGCGCPSLNLRRIFKMNWVAKLVKNLEEMVSGCKVNDIQSPQETESLNPMVWQCASREDSNDKFLYCPSSRDLKTAGISDFRKHWVKGQPIIVKQVCDSSSISSWDPVVIWQEIQETTDERMRDADRVVKAVDCFDWSEVEIELEQFIRGYSEGCMRENGRPQMLKLKDWPSPTASEEFLLYQRPEFISLLPLLEFIHSKWGLLNVAAKLPHYSLQNDVGPKIFIAYGTYEELGRGDSVTNLHLNMRDMVYLLVHSSGVKLKGSQSMNIEKMQKVYKESDAKEWPVDAQRGLNDTGPPGLLLDGHDHGDESRVNLDVSNDERKDGQETINLEHLSGQTGPTASDSCPGAVWDVFHREDGTNPLFDEVVYLNSLHKRKLKEEFGVQPWSFEQHLGQAVFIPAGCPFQVRNLQSTVQLGLDFLSPESLGVAVKLAEEIRCLSDNHAAKLQTMEVGKMSLYAASTAIKEVQKLVLDPKLGAELGFEDPNLTAMVSENLEKMIKQRQIACI
ncbi:hypothetical protein Ancab_000728 [Ancistrocladus abbreviatus]